ncbi:ribonuclease H [uncultured Phenylobacterium sp.]|uniref:ribonuclease H n=1 Tax=uncultured Phenylobacterium sp. TaxID=349273 RepID=UPI0025D1C114|nr:ribonuclease H [uncultured Phenylobacterium sp.]
MKIWIAATQDPAHKNGGWALVRANGEVTGAAGGERQTTRARMALAALAAAIKDLPPGIGPAVVAPRPDALVLHTLVKPPPEPVTEDLDLRAALAAALAGRPWILAIADPKVVAPLTFAAAWADRAADKAKTLGPFTAAIPKVNLGKLGRL